MKASIIPTALQGFAPNNVVFDEAGRSVRTIREYTRPTRETSRLVGTYILDLPNEPPIELDVYEPLDQEHGMFSVWLGNTLISMQPRTNPSLPFVRRRLLRLRERAQRLAELRAATASPIQGTEPVLSGRPTPDYQAMQNANFAIGYGPGQNLSEGRPDA